MGHLSSLLVIMCVLYLPLTEVRNYHCGKIPMVYKTNPWGEGVAYLTHRGRFMHDGGQHDHFQKCSSEELSCNNGRCVPLNLRCDGVDHCGDRSDESACFDCNTGSVHCVAAAPCIHSPSICDGKPDCPDGADEHDCTDLKTKVCSKSEFTCSNGQCVPSSWRCDHSNDCQDGSDELGCDLNECEHENGGCSHLCVDLPLGFICDCPSGMRLVQDTHCEDVDHCLDSDVCDQICIHSNESLACECEDGYDLTPETGQCMSTGGEAHMVVCTHEGMKWMDLYGSEQENITSWVTMRSPGPVAGHNTKNSVYWASPDDDSIYRISVDSSDHSPSEFKASTGILGLAVDELHEHLYWVSTSTHGLHVASLNGSDQKQLISGLSRPTAVAVQPLLGHLFWADSGTSPRIERARLDGHRRLALITSSIRNPVAISLDVPRDLLYWADSGLHTLSRVTFDGKHRKTVVESNGYLDRPFGLAVFESRVYWSDQLTNSTCSANKHNGKELQVSQKLGSVLPAGLAVLQPPLRHADKRLTSLEVKVPLPHSVFVGILFLTVFLSILLVGAVLCWRRSEFSVPHSLSLIGHMSFKESRDPLLVTGPPVVHEHKNGTQPDPEL